MIVNTPTGSGKSMVALGAHLLAIAGHRFPGAYRQKLERYRYGPGVYKVDWALSGPIPWQARECALAGTVHLGGTLEEIACQMRNRQAPIEP